MSEIKAQSFEEVNRVLNRFNRRANKTVMGLLSPNIIALSKELIPESGLVGQLLIPVDGVISSIWAYAPGVTKEKKPILTVELIDGLGVTTSKTFTLIKAQVSVDFNYEVSAGTVLSIYINDPSFVNILFSAIFMPNIGNFKSYNYMYDSIDSVKVVNEVETNEGISDTTEQAATSGTTN
jgi:hypothetical protein